MLIWRKNKFVLFLKPDLAWSNLLCLLCAEKHRMLGQTSIRIMSAIVFMVGAW